MDFEMDLKDIFAVIKKRAWMIIILVLLGTITTGVISFYFLTPQYEASTKLIVNNSNNKSTALDQITLSDINKNIRMIDTYKEIIKTPRIMDKVTKQYPQFHLTSQELIKKITVSSVNNTQVMTIVARDASYQEAADITNAVSMVFKDEIKSIMSVDNVSILSKAQNVSAPTPVSPKKKLNIAISIVVSLMLGVGIAFLLEYMDDSIKNEEDVMKYLNLPTLVTIAKMKEEDLMTNRSKTVPRKIGETAHVTIKK